MLTIIADKGGVDSNSYLSVADADLLADTDYMIYKVWGGIPYEEKEVLLVTATRQIDGLNIKYDKLNENQALKFPVKTDKSDDGFSTAQLACLYQSVYLYENTDTLREAEIDSALGIKSKNIGGISITQTGLNIHSNISPTARNILAKYLNVGVRLARS